MVVRLGMTTRFAVLALALVACAAPVTPDASTPEDAAADVTTAMDGSIDAGCGNGSQRECYSGPAATRGVGVCRAGVQRCFEGSWGACVGEATPGLEVCGNGADDDCNGVVDCPADAGPEAGDAAASDAAPACADVDGDGYGVGAGCMGPDCDDNDRTSHPGAEERCDGQDNNCDGRRDDAFELDALDAYCRRTISPGAAMISGATQAICRIPSRMMSAGYIAPVAQYTCQVCWSAPGGISCECWTDTTRATNCRVR